MKKILTLLCLTCLTGFSFAQSLNFGIKAGVNFSKLSESGSGVTVNTSSTTGFHIGAVADIGFANLSLQPGILYSTKGGSLGSATMGGTAKSTLNYIEVPVNLLYNINVVVGKIFIGGGPYFGYGISGKSTVTGVFTTSGSGTETQNLTFGSGTNDVKNPDYGVNFLGGIRFSSGFSASVGYGLGLANLSNDSSVSTKNNVVSVSIGYFFL
jgi:hypothetical protein